jgi:hypothetical protein
MAPSATSSYPEVSVDIDKKTAAIAQLPTTDRLVASGLNGPIADWHRDLIRDGFAVVKGAIPRERADGYANDMFTWLEDLYDGPIFLFLDDFKYS